MALNPKLLDSLPQNLVDMYAVVEQDILTDMARRISTYDYFIPAAQHQMQKLQELGGVQSEIIAQLSGMTGKTQQEIVDLLADASAQAIQDDVEYYTAAEVYDPKKVNTEALHAQLNAGLLQTQQAFFNLTGTTANTATKQFERALDRAWTQINTGAFSYTTAIRDAIISLSDAGIGAVEYPSGRIDNIDVAVRRAVVTGANQTAMKTQEVLADELEVDLVEVTAHGGARPDHAKWQGQIFGRKKKVKVDGVVYESLKKGTGYGTGAGLGGWNCRHTFHPYIPGAPRAYSDKQLDDYEAKNIEYNGVKMSEYDASQIQRKIERDIRKQKRKIAALEAVGEDASAERATMRGLNKAYTDFTEQTGIRKQSDRTKVSTGNATLSPEPPKLKKKYVTAKTLQADIDDLDNKIIKAQNSGAAQADIDALVAQKATAEKKLFEKQTAAQKKDLKKQEKQLQADADAYDIKTYSGIWKDDVTTKDWKAKKSAIDAKKHYFQDKVINAVSVDDANKFKALYDLTDAFDKDGAAYYGIVGKLDDVKDQLDILVHGVPDKYSQKRKDNAVWFTDKNGSTKAADAVYRAKCGEVWKAATKAQKDSAYEYTQSYHKYNEPLRGIVYGTNQYVGPGKVDLDDIGTSYSGFKKGQVHKLITDLSAIIKESKYKVDAWVQRGCKLDGMDKFFGISQSDFGLSVDELSKKLVGTKPTEYAFMSTGVARGKGLNTSGGVVLNIYAPAGTEMLYCEPFSAFGNGSGHSWDGDAPQSSFGHEAEMLLQAGTHFRITKVDKSNGTWYVDMEVTGQDGVT